MDSTLRWTGLIGMCSIAVMRCAIEFVPDPYFDIDPAITPGSRAAAGPLISLALDVILLMSCAAALLGESLARRRFDWLLLMLAAIGAIPVIAHGWRDLDDLWRGSTWLAAIIGAVAAAHLARDRTMRHVLFAILFAAAVPVITRGAVQTLYEHAQTVATFRDNADHILRQQGIEPGSPSAAIYERRLMQNQPIGWFITTNVFATMMAGTLVMSIGLMIAAVRAKLPGGWSGAIGLVGFASAAGLSMTGSKGAIGVAAIGVALLLLPTISTPVRRVVDRFGGGIAIALLAIVLLGVVIRGTLLPESFANDRSLLFRWHYMVASARIIADEPWIGTGPDHFQQFYTLHRLPRNPEEVASAHSIFLDWLATLGIPGGASWVALVIILLWRAGRSASNAANPLPDDRADSNRSPMLACAFAFLALIVAMMIEWRVVASDPVIVISRVIGATGFLAIALIVLRVVYRADERLARWTLAAGAITLMMHSQIEMTLTQPNAAVWGLMLLGVAAGSAPSRRRGTGALPALVMTIIACAISLLIICLGLIPAWNRESAMSSAAGMLRPIAEIRWNLNQAIAARDSTTRSAAITRLGAAIADSGFQIVTGDLQAAVRGGPESPAFGRFESSIDSEEQRRRIRAATDLMGSGEWRALVAAAEQLASVAELAARDGENQRHAYLTQAADVAERAADESGRPRASSLAGNLAHRLAVLTGDPSLWSRAIGHLQTLCDGDPHGISPWKRLGDALWDAGRREEAAKAYQRALENDANFELDPLKQLRDQERLRIQQRIEFNPARD